MPPKVAGGQAGEQVPGVAGRERQRTGEKWVPADRWLTPSVDGTPAFLPGRFIAEECEKHGVLLFNFVPNTVTIAPPLKITRDELTFALEALEQAFTALDEHTVSARA